MRRAPTPVIPRVLAVLCILLSTSLLTASAHSATVSWNVDASGDWDVGSNWSGGVVPTIGDTVIIDRAAGLYTITVPTGTHAAYSILSNERLVLDAGNLTVATTVQVNSDLVLDGTELIGATVLPGSGGEGMDAVTGTLNGVTMNADMDISASSNRTITLTNGLTLNGAAFMGDEGSAYGRFLTTGTQTLDGTGEIELGGASFTSGVAVNTGDLTIESGLTIHGAQGTIGSSNRRLVLKAPVTAEVSGEEIRLQGDSLLIQARASATNGATLRVSSVWVNQDSVVADGGSTLNLDGTWANQGGIRMTDGTVLLGGTVTTAGIGGFVRSGGTVTVDGTIDNTGDQLQLDASTGSWLLAGGTILGGSVEPGLAGSELLYASSTLDGVTMNTDMDLSEPASMSITLRNGLTLNATAFMGDEGTAFGRFLTSGTQTLDGTGEILLGRASFNNGVTVNTGDLTIESGLTIHGAQGTIGSSNRRLVLKAPVTADSTGEEIRLSGDSLIVQAPVTAVNGADLRIDGPALLLAKASVSGGGRLQLVDEWANADTLEAGTGCELDLDGTWSNLGAIRPTDATVTLGGNFAWADVGDFVRSGGTVTVDGTLDNTGNALTLDANTGSWLLAGGTILGGSVEPGLAGSELLYASSTLDGVTMNTDMDLSEPASMSITLRNGLTLNATAFMGDEGTAFGRFLTSGTQTLDGTGEILLGRASFNNGVTVNTGDLTIESGLTIHGAQGTIGTTNRRLVLKAPVTADSTGEEIRLSGDSLIVQAPVTAVNGADLRIDGPALLLAKASVSGGGRLQLVDEWANADTLEAGTGCELDLDGTWSNLGAIRPTDATVTLGGNFAWADVGDFVRSGGTVTVDGTLDNTANALTLDANTGSWLLAGGTIVGGSVEAGTGGAELLYASSTLDGVTVNTDMDLSEPASMSITLRNGLTLNATAFMGDEGTAFGRFLTSGTQTLDGTGEILLGRASFNNGVAVNTGDLTIESGLTIHGAQGTIGQSNRRLVLKAPVTADSTGEEIRLSGDSLIVQAPVTAVNGADLRIDGPALLLAKASVSGGGRLQLVDEWANADTLEAGTGCELDLDGTWSNLGAIRPTDATVTLGGNFAWADVGDFVRSGGTVTVDGTLDNTANALTLDANTGSWLLAGGTILGGSVEPGLAGSELRYGSNSTLNGVTMNADMDMSENFGITITLLNGLTLNGSALLGDVGASLGRFLTSGTQTLDGTGEILLGGASLSSGVLINTGALTMESGLTIHGERGTIGGTNRALTNRAVVRSDSAGGIIRLLGTSWANEGSVIAVLGTIDNDAPLTNDGTVRIDSSAVLSGSGSFVQNSGSTHVDGTLVMDPVDIDGGVLSGNGTLDGDVDIANSTIAPGSSAGTLTGTGTLTQTAGAYSVEIAGAGPANYDRLDFTGTAAIAGSLGVALDSFIPALDDTFTIVSASAISGDYGNLNLPLMIPSQRWLVEPAANEYRLIVEPNFPPAAACRDTMLTTDLDCTASVDVALLDDGTVDPEGDPFTLVLDPAPPYAIGTHMVNFIATDSLGAADTCLTTITVINNAPVAMSRDTVLTSGPSCDATVTAAALDSLTFDPDGKGFTLALEPAGPYAIGVHQVLFIATDDCGAADTTTSTITVLNSPPIASSRDTVLVSGIACDAAITAAALDSFTVDPEGQGFTLAIEPVGPFAIGVHQVLFIATDDCGAADTTSSTITVINTAPIASSRDTTLIGLPPNWEADVTAAALDSFTVDPEGQGLTFSVVPTGPYPLGVTQVSFIATDDCGLADTTTSTITVINNPPIAACNDTTLFADASCEGVVAAADIDDGSTDPEGGPLTFELIPAGPYAIGVHQVAFVVTDDCGGTDTCSTTITVINNAPIAAATDTALVAGPPNWEANVTAADLDRGTADPEGHGFTLALVPPGPYPLGANQVLFIATDDCGAADTLQLTIAVNNNPPVAIPRDTVTIATDNVSCNGVIAAAAVDSATFDPDGNDFTVAIEPTGPFPLGVTPILFIATDECGDSDTVATAIRVINNKPVASVVEFNVVSGDSLTCEADVPASGFDDGSSDADGHTLSFTVIPAGPYSEGITPVLFIASDGCQSDTVQTQIQVVCGPVAVNPPGPTLQFAVHDPMPNPTRGTTRIRFTLPEARDVRVNVFDVAGRRVATLMDRRMDAGNWDVAWDGRRDDGSMSGAGVYMVSIQAGRDHEVRRAVRVR